MDTKMIPVIKPSSEPQPAAPHLPLDVAAILLGTRWAEPLADVRPRY